MTISPSGSFGESLVGMVAKPAGWVDPPRPQSGACPCGAVLEPSYAEPAFWNGNLIAKTGEWFTSEKCTDCWQRDVDDQKVKDQAERMSEMIASAGFEPIHQTMTIQNYRITSDAVKSVLDAAKLVGLGMGNLFLVGPAGVGKTHLAVGALRTLIETKSVQGYFCVVAELMDELRRGSKGGADAELVSRLTSAGGLVLDDLGVERTTAYATERLYLILDRWYRKQKNGLVITSNKHLAWISEHLDDRIASRIAGMCEVHEVSGEDWRLKRKTA